MINKIQNGKQRMSKKLKVISLYLIIFLSILSIFISLLFGLTPLSVAKFEDLNGEIFTKRIFALEDKSEEIKKGKLYVTSIPRAINKPYKLVITTNYIKNGV